MVALLAALSPAKAKCYRMKFALSGILIYALILAPQGEAFSAPGGPEDVEWHLLELSGAPIRVLPGERKPYLLLDVARHQARGFTGCNSFFGNYELAGATLRFGLIGATRKACPDTDPTREANFLDVLARTRRWTIDGSELLLGDGGNVLARFAMNQEAQPAANLESLTFHSKVLASGPVNLARGAYRAPAAPGSASEMTARLTDKRAFGVLSGRSVGAVIVATSMGGTGTFYELALLAKGRRGG